MKSPHILLGARVWEEMGNMKMAPQSVDPHQNTSDRSNNLGQEIGN